jgi:hypothetical protein
LDEHTKKHRQLKVEVRQSEIFNHLRTSISSFVSPKPHKQETNYRASYVREVSNATAEY